MILNQTNVNVEKSEDFESIDFRIDSKYNNKVLWMLINQYKHKVRTPVQEILSNARDAQRENGNPDRPIKIQLPTKLESIFKVRDYGVGMDEKRIKDIFTSFGASTKNVDNSQTGGFGIGAKSPLTYTDSFNIKTYVNGKYWVYIVAITENEGISINLIDSGETTEENGTEVQIPVKQYDVNEFITASNRCTMFWDVKPILNIEDDFYERLGLGTEIASNFRVYDDNELNSIFNSGFIVVVDGIPYELDHSDIKKVDPINRICGMINYGTHAVLFLNTGDIDLLQTRESIDLTERTASQLELISRIALDDLKTYIESCFTDKTLIGRINQFRDVKNKFTGFNNHKFETFNITVNYFYLDKKINLLEYSYRSRSTSGLVSTIQRHVNDNAFKTNDIDRFYWDDLKDSESDTMKARRMRYQVEQSGNRVILIKQGDSTNFVYTRTLRLLGAKKLSSLCKPPKQGSKAHSKGVQREATEIYAHILRGCISSYGSVTKYSKKMLLSELKTKVIYGGYREDNSWLDNPRAVRMLTDELKFKVVRLAKKDIKKIENDARFIHVDEFEANFKPTKDMINQVINNERIGGNRNLAKIIVADKNKITDKILVEMAKKVFYDNSKKGIVMPRFFERKIEKDYEKKLHAINIMDQMFKQRVATKYPLLSSNDRKHSVNYINLVNKGA